MGTNFVRRKGRLQLLEKVNAGDWFQVGTRGGARA